MAKKAKKNVKKSGRDARDPKAKVKKKTVKRASGRKKTAKPVPTAAADAARKSFLRRLARLAWSPSTDTARAAMRLDMTEAQFEEMLRTDAQARSVWEKTKADLLLKIDRQLLNSAADGNAAAVRHLLDLLQRTITCGGNVDAMSVTAIAELFDEKPDRIRYWLTLGAPVNADKTISLPAFLAWYKSWLTRQLATDPLRVKTMPELCKLVGKTKPTIYEWLKEGLPRNKDNSFTIPDVMTWLLDRIGGKTAPAAQSNPLAEAKAEKTALQVAVMKKTLVPASEALALKMWTAWKVTAWLDANTEKLYMDLAGLTADRVKLVIDKAFSELRTEACKRPSNYDEILPEDVAAKFVEILEMLGGGDE